jgi:hypothetical protein
MPDLQALAAEAPRNSPCPCGSGRKAKHCHADPADPAPPTTVPVFVAEPRRRVTGMSVDL